MRAVRAFGILGSLLVGAFAGAARADLPRPPVNQGATEAVVDGTKVRAEAWALGKGHEVEAVVVARLAAAAPEGTPAVTTWERWTLDGKPQAERGDKKLASEWAKRLGDLLEEVERAARAKGDPVGASGKGKDARSLVERFLGRMGAEGSSTRDGWTLGWSIALGEGHGKDGRSEARTAIFTWRPAGEPSTPPDGPASPKGPVTPREDRGDAVPESRLPAVDPAAPTGGGTASAASGADGEQGARAHSRVEVDLAAGRRTPATPSTGTPDAPRPDVTPRER